MVRNTDRGISRKASGLYAAARNQSTTSKLTTLGALAAGAAAVAYFKDAGRRAKVQDMARDYGNRVTSWWDTMFPSIATPAHTGSQATPN